MGISSDGGCYGGTSYTKHGQTQCLAAHTDNEYLLLISRVIDTKFYEFVKADG